ncbi:hypothetical protein SLEP1_g59862, partial [Rubroshorea leprosula]
LEDLPPSSCATKATGASSFSISSQMAREL